MFEPITLVSALLTVLGAGLGPFAKATRRRDREIHLSGLEPGQRVLVGFAVIVVAFGILTLVRYWDAFRQKEDLFYYAGWLFVAMVAGMFVQVIASNYRSGKPLFEVTASQLIFPMLFSIIVFYGIWVTASSAPAGLFPFYAAFLNGFFWESVVSATKPPTPPNPPGPPPPPPAAG